MEEVTKLTEDLEYIFLKHLADHLTQERMSAEEAKEYAQEFLKTMPFASIGDAQLKMDQFAKKYSQFEPLKSYADSFHREQHVDSKISQMVEHMRANRIDEALQIAKQ